MPKVPRKKKHFCVWVKKDETVCGMGFETPTDLVRHIRTHTGEKSEICHELNDNGEECGMCFGRKDYLQKYINVKHKKQKKDRICTHVLEDGPWKGERCGKSFRMKDELVDHMQHHTGMYHNVCELFNDEGILCGKGCTSATFLQKHVMSNHTDKNSPEYLKYRDKQNQYYRELYANNVEFRVSTLMRNAFTRFMNNHGGKTVTTGRTQVLLGCTWEELVIHLNDNPHGYTLDMDGIDIDHIRCIISFMLGDPIEQHRCMNFNNLQLLPKHENRNVKRATYIPAEYEQTDAYKAIELLVPEWVELYTA